MRPGQARLGAAWSGAVRRFWPGKTRRVQVRHGKAVMVCHGLTRHGRVGIGWASYGGYGGARSG